MQAKTIVKFIFSIIASLALLCIIFPNDGIPFFGTKLKFPSIAEVIKTPVDSALIGEAPKDVINKRKSDLDIAKENEFRSFCETNPARFFMPNNDVTYFDNLFKDCKNITYVDFSTFKFSYNNIKYTSASDCLYAASNLIQCKMSSAANNILSSTPHMFADCFSLIKFDANNFTAASVINASYMFSRCSSLEDGSQFNNLTFNSLENAKHIFSGASHLKNINIEIDPNLPLSSNMKLIVIGNTSKISKLK